MVAWLLGCMRLVPGCCAAVLAAGLPARRPKSSADRSRITAGPAQWRQPPAAITAGPPMSGRRPCGRRPCGRAAVLTRCRAAARPGGRADALPHGRAAVRPSRCGRADALPHGRAAVRPSCRAAARLRGRAAELPCGCTARRSCCRAAMRPCGRAAVRTC